MGILGRQNLRGRSALMSMLLGTLMLASGFGRTTTGCTRSAVIVTAGATRELTYRRGVH